MASPGPPTLTPEQIAYQENHASDNKGTLIRVVSIVLIVFTTLAVTLRFVARRSRKLYLGADDWFALVSWVFTIPLSALNISMIQWGLGRHIWTVDPTTGWKVIQSGLFFTCCYCIVHWWIKMSIIFFYHRVFSFRTPWFKYACILCGIYATAWSIASFFVTLFQCFPVQHFWQQLDPTRQPPSVGTCGVNNSRAALSTSALNSLLDLVLFALPIGIIWKLHLKRSRKISLLAVFATGAFACTAGLLRLSKTYISVQPGADATWIVADVFLWTAAEASVGLICACLPIIGPLFGIVRENVRSYLSRQSLGSERYGTELVDREAESRTALASSPLVKSQTPSGASEVGQESYLPK